MNKRLQLLLLLPIYILYGGKLYGQQAPIDSLNHLTPQQVKLLFVGDLMQHQAQIDAARRADGRYDYSHCFSLVGERIAQADIAIGNIIGSNIFNMLMIIGVSALITPLSYNLSYNVQLGILLLALVLLEVFAFTKPKNQMTRTNGLIYVGMYVAYLVLQIGRAHV